MTSRQIEAGRRKVKRGGKLWIRVFPDKPIPKPLEVRQGKGKGNVEYWVAQIQPGRVLYEIEGVTEEQAREAFTLAAAKLPFETTFVKADGNVMKASDFVKGRCGTERRALNLQGRFNFVCRGNGPVGSNPSDETDTACYRTCQNRMRKA